MAGFRKAKAEQAALKMALYGLAGSGKTFTSLMLAEGLAKISGKRVAYIDTERGTDFYCKSVPERSVHPEAFDFDALYTRSITEIMSEVKALSAKEYGVIVLDSITHVWEAAREAYAGRETKAGTIPIWAWAKIKKPYKELITYLLNSPMHVIMCGRQGNEYDEDEKTGDMKKVGTKMKAEGETAYEPHILINMEAVRNKSGIAVITAFAEKDRTGILSGKVIENPGFDTLVKPLLPLLGGTQAQIEDVETTSRKDAEAITDAEKKAIEESEIILASMSAKITLCKTLDELKAIGKEITPDLKKKMIKEDVATLRECYTNKESSL